MTIKKIIDKSLQKLESFDVNLVLPELELANEGAIADVLNRTSCGYYQFTPGLIDELKPRQIVELGGAMGVWDICVMAGTTYKDFDLWSITLPENGLEFSYITSEQQEKWPNMHLVLGDDLNLNNWPKKLDLHKTDLYFFDSDHREDQLRAEIELYKQFFKPGNVLLFDDIFLERDGQKMQNVWNDMENLFPVAFKQNLGNPLHWSGYGIVQIGE